MIEVEHRTSDPSRITNHESRHQRILGQYFTPEPVVALCYRMLRDLDPDTTNPSIIDPSCGSGAFLSHALDRGLTTPDRLFGVEKDPSVAETIHLSGVRIFIGDGLSRSSNWRPAKSEIPSPRSEMAFDWVVGNPPFGSRGESDVEPVKAHFSVWRANGVRGSSRYPIEILFLERFVQLAKPGGHIAVIVPDGILSNARLSYVREWLCEHAEIMAVVGLPQRTFHRQGTAAKASVLVLRKRHRIETDEREYGGVELWEYAGVLHRLQHSPVPPFRAGDRLDPAYYHPDFTENARFLSGLPAVVPLGDLIGFTTYGAVGSRKYSQSGVRYITPANLLLDDEGYTVGVGVHSPERFVAEGSHSDPPRSRLRRGDLLLANSGVGCIGRAAVFCSDEPCNISQHINLMRLAGIEPEYVAAYLQTRFGRLQIQREKCGVGACGINFDRIRGILMPVLPAGIRREVVRRYARGKVGRAVALLEGGISSEGACR